MFRFLRKSSQTPAKPPQEGREEAARRGTQTNSVLNVGGNSKAIPIPPYYDGWEHILLDIDPTGEPDIVCDARSLTDLPNGEYDSVYCSHNLEHYFRHDVYAVLNGFMHVLKEGGFAYIRVPDMEELMKTVAQKNLDIDDFLYDSPAGPITVRDVIYGYGKEIEESGEDFFAHKTGFTSKSLTRILKDVGFSHIFTRTGNLEVTAIAFKERPSDFALRLLEIPDSLAADNKR